MIFSDGYLAMNSLPLAEGGVVEVQEVAVP